MARTSVSIKFCFAESARRDKNGTWKTYGFLRKPLLKYSRAFMDYQFSAFTLQVVEPREVEGCVPRHTEPVGDGAEVEQNALPGPLTLAQCTCCTHLSPQGLVRSGQKAVRGEPGSERLVPVPGLTTGGRCYFRSWDSVSSGARWTLLLMPNSAHCAALGFPTFLSTCFLVCEMG